MSSEPVFHSRVPSQGAGGAEKKMNRFMHQVKVTDEHIQFI